MAAHEDTYTNAGLAFGWLAPIEHYTRMEIASATRPESPLAPTASEGPATATNELRRDQRIALMQPIADGDGNELAVDRTRGAQRSREAVAEACAAAFGWLRDQAGAAPTSGTALGPESPEAPAKVPSPGRWSVEQGDVATRRQHAGQDQAAVASADHSRLGPAGPGVVPLYFSLAALPPQTSKRAFQRALRAGLPVTRVGYAEVVTQSAWLAYVERGARPRPNRALGAAATDDEILASPGARARGR